MHHTKVPGLRGTVTNIMDSHPSDENKEPGAVLPNRISCDDRNSLDLCCPTRSLLTMGGH